MPPRPAYARYQAERTIAEHPWREPLTIILLDGTERTGTLKHRGARGFSLSDDIWTIGYANVAEIRPVSAR